MASYGVLVAVYLALIVAVVWLLRRLAGHPPRPSWPGREVPGTAARPAAGRAGWAAPPGGA